MNIRYQPTKPIKNRPDESGSEKPPADWFDHADSESSESQVFDSLLVSLVSLTDSEYGLISEKSCRDDGSPILITRAVTNYDSVDETRGSREQNPSSGMDFNDLETLLEGVLTSEQPIVANDFTHVPQRGGAPPKLTAFLSLPVMLDDELVGAVGLANGVGGYSDAVIEGVQPLLASVAAVIRVGKVWREREARFREIAKNLPGIVFEAVSSADGRFKLNHTSESVAEILGLSPGQVAHENFDPFSLIVPEDRAGIGEAIAQAISAISRGNVLAHEARFQTESGDVKWIRVTATPHREERRDEIIWHGVLLDIDQHKRTERTLRADARQLAALVDLGQVAINEMDLNALADNFVRVVAQTLDVEFCDVLTSEPGDDKMVLWAGIGWHERLLGKETVKINSRTEAGFAILSGQPVVVDDLITDRRFGGSRLHKTHGVVSGISVVIQGSKCPFGVLAAHTAERRTFSADDVRFLQVVANLLAEAIQRVKTNEAQRTREENYRNLLDDYVDCVALTVDGKVVYANPQATRVTGYLPEEFIGHSPIAFIAPKDRCRAKERIAAVMAGAPPARMEYELIHKRGHSLTIEIVSSAIRHLDRPTLLWVLRDVTDRKCLEDRLHRAEHLASLGTLAAGIAHEINNPMTAAWTAAETAKTLTSRPAARGMFDQCLDAVIDSVQRCQAIIDNVTRFTQQQSLPKSLGDLNEIIRQSVEISADKLDANRATIELKLAEGLPQIPVNAQGIEQVLTNLFRNAVQAGNATSITVTTEARSRVVKIRVTDNGRGLPEQHVDRIFDPFFTTDESGTGMGLGLAISHFIIQSHDGIIEVESQLDVGTTFVISLPLPVSDRPRQPRFQ